MGQFFLNLAGVVIAAISSFFFLREVKLRRKLEKEHIENRQAQHTEILEFQRERFDIENESLQRQSKLINRGLQNISHITGGIAKQIKDELVADPTWLSVAQSRSEIQPFENTIFGARYSHFRAEKETIASAFSAKLVWYVEQSLEHYENVYLLVDSGTTLYPFFQKLGSMATEAWMQGERPEWLKRMHILTNNLPAVVNVLRIQSGIDSNGLSAIPLNLTLVGGQPLKEYAAVTGAESLQALTQFVNERRKSQQSLVISLVTGNWIRLRRTQPICPIPLARGLGHLDFKQLMMSISDESYVVGPLGKIFLDESIDEINNLLDLHEGASSLKQSPYVEIDTNHEDFPINENRVRLVTSYRTKDAQILQRQGARICERYGIRDKYTHHNENLFKDRVSDPILIPFDHVGSSKQEQIDLDFPHSKTHNEQIFNSFGVNF